MNVPERGLTAEINVTPLIDVLLVLLVVYLLVPLKRPVLDVNVPPDRSASGQDLPQIVLELRADRSYAVNGTTIRKEDLKRRLTAIYAARPLKLLFIKAGPGWRYGEVMAAADIALGAGVQVIGYVPRRP